MAIAAALFVGAVAFADTVVFDGPGGHTMTITGTPGGYGHGIERDINGVEVGSSGGSNATFNGLVSVWSNTPGWTRRSGGGGGGGDEGYQ